MPPEPAPPTQKQSLDGYWSGSLECRGETVRRLDHLPVEDGRLIAIKLQSGKNLQSHNFSGEFDPEGGIELKGSITWESGVSERLWMFAKGNGDRITGEGSRISNKAWGKNYTWAKFCAIVLTLD